MLTRPLLIIKTGATIEALQPVFGDFDDWFLSGLGIDRARSIVRRVDLDEDLPSPTAVAGVVITGSSAMVSHRLAWSERAARWLAAAVPGGLPILGVCYGHQLLAHALGGHVGPNPNGREIGSVAVRLTPAASADRIFSTLGPEMKVQETHVESVLELPPGAVRLAGSHLDHNQAFRIGPAAWGVQFHPEFGAEVLRAYVEHRRPVLEDEGFDVDAVLTTIEETPAATSILPLFLDVVAQRLPQ